MTHNIGIRSAVLAMLLTGNAWPQSTIVELYHSWSASAWQDGFGAHVAVDHDVAAISGDFTRAVFVFRRKKAGVWPEQQILRVGEGAVGPFVRGVAVGVNGILVATSDNFLHSYGRDREGVWTEQQRLTDSHQRAGAAYSDLALAGSIAVISAIDVETGCGSVFVFAKDSDSVWVESQELFADDVLCDNMFGSSVAIDGETIVVGADRDDELAPDSGAAYVFRHEVGGMWVKQQKLLPDIETSPVSFGSTVAVAGDTLMVGGSGTDGQAAENGVVYVFERDSSNTWRSKQVLAAPDESTNCHFGADLAMSNATALVGVSMWDHLGGCIGSAYTFTRDPGGIWTERERILANSGGGTYFGRAVALDGSTAIIGAPVAGDPILDAPGIAYALELDVPVFSDVPIEHWAFKFVGALTRARVTAGCGVSRFCPDQIVTRAQLAVLLERSMSGSDFSPPAATGNVFLDVGASDFAASFIEQLFLDGITAGCGQNNYCPDDSVTRAQMAVFLLRAKHGSGYSPPPATGVFGDVDLSHWAVHWIEKLAAEGITSGCGDGNFCPEDLVTRDQMAVFLVKTFGL